MDSVTIEVPASSSTTASTRRKFGFGVGRMTMHFVVTGHQLNVDAVARAVALSHEKYCSATAMLAKTAQVTTSHELIAV